MNVIVTYWYSSPDQTAYLEHCGMINQEVVRRFAEEKIPISILP